MYFETPYWIWPGQIDKATCELIVSQGNQLPLKEGLAGGKLNLEIRKSQIGWFPKDHWVEGVLLHHIFKANRAAWNFDLSGNESVQFTNYGHDEFYHPHLDVNEFSSIMRKVSVVLQLDPPENYKGGELLFLNERTSKYYKPAGFEVQGSIIVFPSMTWHQVTAVTSGMRHSAVMWANGPQFR